MSKWITSTAFYAAYVVLFYLWQVAGMEGAGNVLTTWLYIEIAMMLVVPFGFSRMKESDLERSTAWAVYCYSMAMTIFVAMAWIGRPFLASMYIFAELIMWCARTGALNKKREEREAAAAGACDAT